MVTAEPDEKENCSICLGEVENRGRISCDHKFCFECIHNWSKVTNLCPICKKAFKKITAVADSTEKKRGVKRKGPPKEMKVIYTPSHGIGDSNWTDIGKALFSFSRGSIRISSAAHEYPEMLLWICTGCLLPSIFFFYFIQTTLLPWFGSHIL